MRWSVRFVAIALCIIINPIKTVFSQDCELTWENGTKFENPEFGVYLNRILDSAAPGTKLLSAKAVNVKKITSTVSSTISPEKYIEPTLVGDSLILTLTDHFVEYEENEISDKMSITIDFECLAGTQLKREFIQLIEDTNNHSPKFTDEPYIYTLPMPFPKNVQLNHFKAIYARDVDVTNSNITFHLDPADKNSAGFSVTWLSRDTDDRKRFSATLVTNAVIDLAEDVTFSLLATDAGTPPRTSKVDIKIVIDRASSILRFARPLYIADLTKLSPEEAQREPIKFTEGEVQLDGGSDGTVQYTILDNLNGYEKNFELTSASSTVSLRLVNPPAEFFKQSFVILSLTAHKTGSEVTTVLHLSLPGLSSVPTSSTTSTSTTPKSTTSTSTTSTTKPTGIPEASCAPEREECDNSDYIVVIVILAILLTVVTLGFAVFVIMNCRKPKNVDRLKDGENHIRPEMGEIRNGSVNSNGALRRSVAFNDNVEEMKTVRL